MEPRGPSEAPEQWPVPRPAPCTPPAPRRRDSGRRSVQFLSSSLSSSSLRGYPASPPTLTSGTGAAFSADVVGTLGTERAQLVSGVPRLWKYVVR